MSSAAWARKAQGFEIAGDRAQIVGRVQRHFTEHGTSSDVGSDRPFALDSDCVWLVERGFVDVFMVATRAGGVQAARRHVTRVVAGNAIVGFSDTADSTVRLIAVGAADTLIWQQERIALWDSLGRLDLGDGQPTRGDLTALLEGWAFSLCGGIISEVPPRSCREIGGNDVIPVAKRGALRPGLDVVWLSVDGAATFAGRPSLPVTPSVAYPVSRHLWVVAAEETTMRTREPETLGDGIWASLAELHALVLRAATLNAERTAQADGERQRRRNEENWSAFAGAMRHLAGALRLNADRREVVRSTTRRDGSYGALLTTMRRVANEVGVTITPPTTAGWIDAQEPVDAVARSSKIRIRRVKLVGEWWKRDAGALVGYTQTGPKTREAVALLPLPSGGYDMLRPDGERIRITEATARRLLPIATAMYRSFPPVPLALRDVLAFAMKGSWRDIIRIALLGAAAGMLGMLIPYATGLLFDFVIPSADRSQLVQVAAILVVVAMATATFELVRTIALLRVEGRMQVTVQAALWDRLLDLPISFFRNYTAGDLAVRAMSIDGIRQVLTGTVTSAIMGGIFSVFNFGMMYWYSPGLAWRGTLLIVVILVVTMAAAALQLRAHRQISLLRARTSGLVLQLLTSIAKLRVAGAEVRAFAIWAKQFGEQRRYQFVARFIRNTYATVNAAFPIISSIVIFTAAAGMLAASAEAAKAGTPAPPPLRTGEFLAFLAAFSMCLNGTLAIGSSIIAALSIVPLYEQARPIFTAIPELTEARRDPGDLEGDIEVQHLCFRYVPNSPLVLNDFSFRVRPGESVALVGPSGSGKSTVVRALLGFEVPESGTIYLDGHDVSGLDMQAVRRQIGVVLQNGRLNAGDIFNNIVGSSLATEEAAWAAAEMAGLAEDIRSMPMGMNTMVAEGGGTLSGGQRQRLMIARAFVNRPKIVIFDEATSALDNRTQAIVSESLARLNATRIVVAHRLSTVMAADRIFVVMSGRVVESGTYEELMRMDGAFAELARRQLT